MSIHCTRTLFFLSSCSSCSRTTCLINKEKKTTEALRTEISSCASSSVHQRWCQMGLIISIWEKRGKQNVKYSIESKKGFGWCPRTQMTSIVTNHFLMVKNVRLSVFLFLCLSHPRRNWQIEAKCERKRKWEISANLLRVHLWSSLTTFDDHYLL